jgi:NADPH:quinone reductase-like Zn-dependent oxidoreductase
VTETMRRWTMDAVGRDRLELTSAPIPRPRPGEALIKVAAASLNYRDKLVIESGMGLPLTFPFTPASDMAGVVVETGEGAARFEPGDRVISTFSPGWIDGLNDGSARRPPYKTLGGVYPGVLSDYLALPEGWLSRAPQSLDDAEASTLPCAGLTAWFALVERGRLHAGESVLVHGTGGVALFGLQIAKAHGAETMVVSREESKLTRAKALGADFGVNRSAGDWVAAVLERTGDRGVDHIVETVGGANLGGSIKAAAMGAHIAVIGVLDGFEVSGPVGPLMLKNLTIQGIGVGHRRSLEEFVRAVDRLALKPVIDARYALTDLTRALDHLDRGPFGKIVIEMG